MIQRLLLAVFAAIACSAPGAQVTTVKGIEAEVQDGLVSLTFSLSTPGLCVIGLDMRGSSILKFVDNKGGDLGTKPPGTPDYLTMPIYASCGTDGEHKAITITVTSPRKVTAGASEFTLEGIANLNTADKLETGEIKGLKIQKDAEVAMAGLKGRITNVKKADTLEFDVAFTSWPAGIEFNDAQLKNAQGEELRGSHTRTRVKVNEQETTTMSFFGIQPPLEVLTLEYSVWQGVKGVQIPFKTSASTGGVKRSPPSPVAVTPAPVAPTEKPPQPEKAPPATVQPPAAEATGTAWPKLKISGVIGSGKTGAVIINGRTVDVGGRISGVAVEDIRDGAVILKYRNETRKLRSGESL